MDERREISIVIVKLQIGPDNDHHVIAEGPVLLSPFEYCSWKVSDRPGSG